MPEVIERALGVPEREFLKNKIESYERQLRSDLCVVSISLLQGFSTAALIVGLALCYKLSVAYCVLIFFIVGGALSFWWIRKALRKQGEIEDVIIKYHDVVLANCVQELEIHAQRYIEIEAEHEFGGGFLFEIVDKKSLLILNYSTASLFPTTNFLISCILDARGDIVERCLVGIEPITPPCKKVTLKEGIIELVNSDWNMTVLDCGIDDFESFLLEQKRDSK